jgi:hypothetical protein
MTHPQIARYRQRYAGRTNTTGVCQTCGTPIEEPQYPDNITVKERRAQGWARPETISDRTRWQLMKEMAASRPRTPHEESEGAA